MIWKFSKQNYKYFFNITAVLDFLSGFFSASIPTETPTRINTVIDDKYNW